MTVIALDLTKITCHPVQTILVLLAFFQMRLTWLGYIDSCGWGGVFLLLLLLVILTTFFFFLLPSFSGELRVRPRWNCQFWGIGFWLFHSKVLYQIGLGLGRQGMHRLIALVALLVAILTGGGLYHGFSFGSDCFFDLGVPTF